MSQSFVIRGDICFSTEPRTLQTLAGGYLVCVDGVSAGVYAELPQRYQGLPVFDHGGALVMPGLVDLHVHAPQYAHRALGMDLELLQWLETWTFPQEAKYRDLAYAERAYAAFVREVQRGPNTRAVVFGTQHVPATLRLMEMLEASGLVTMVGKVNMDRNGGADLQEADAQASLRDTQAWLAQAQGRFARTQPILTPRFIPACTDALMQGIAALQARTNLPVQSHLSENRQECDWVQALCPASDSYADAYRRFGLFGGDVRTVMAHGVWLSDAEIDMIAERGVYIAHCPQSNMNLSSGIAPVRRMLARGVRVGLGSDVAGGCHTSIFRAMTDAVQVSKLRWRLQDQTEPALSLEEAFYMATVGGGSFFGKVGSFAPGYELDALVIDDSGLATPEPLTIAERLARVAYLPDGWRIVSKYVRGDAVALCA